MKVRLVQLATLVGGTVVLLDYFVELAFIERTAAAFLHWSVLLAAFSTLSEVQISWLYTGNGLDRAAPTGTSVRYWSFPS